MWDKCGRANLPDSLPAREKKNDVLCRGHGMTTEYKRSQIAMLEDVFQTGIGLGLALVLIQGGERRRLACCHLASLLKAAE